MRIAIITDAWRPQINGVVTTLSKTGESLRALGHEVLFITPEFFRTVPCPTYSSIRLAVNPIGTMGRLLDNFSPHAVHIATEGPLGWAARGYCKRRNLRFTSSYHTQFPHYINMRIPLPIRWSYAVLRYFHNAAVRTMVPTLSQRRELKRWWFRNVVIWPRGVDTDMFQPADKSFLDAPRPIAMYAGRVAVEKNLQAFLSLDMAGSKYVVGDGPDLEKLRRKYPAVQFTGFKSGAVLAAHLAAADVFVFPSRTDTFGLVMLEAMACGIPVAAFPVTGPVDVVLNGATGVLHEDLGIAVQAALRLDGRVCREYALAHSWRQATEYFAANLVDNRESVAHAIKPTNSLFRARNKALYAQTGVIAEENQN
ncbi:MAG: glycosyltransferase family 1 protein [Gammaproteobacteria bacterium]|nr:glycosyltransferase family 1 protein [Gammaproteobacteria bacterium]